MAIGTMILARLDGATSAGNRVYPEILPQTPTYPAISYQQISSVPLHAMGADAMTRIRVQVDVWGLTYKAAHDLAAQVSGLLSRYRGTAGGIVVMDCLKDNEADAYESDTQTRRVTQDFTFFVA